MGRRSINTTKSGKFMNPTDQARKEARKRELKKNKKQRTMVRMAVLKNKDPSVIMSEMRSLDLMEFDPLNPPPYNLKVLHEKRKKLTEMWDRVIRLYGKEDPTKVAEMKVIEKEYEQWKKELCTFYESVQQTRRVKVDDIPLPNQSATTSILSYLVSPNDIPLPVNPDCAPPTHLLGDVLQPSVMTSTIKQSRSDISTVVTHVFEPTLPSQLPCNNTAIEAAMKAAAAVLASKPDFFNKQGSQMPGDINSSLQDTGIPPRESVRCQSPDENELNCKTDVFRRSRFDDRRLPPGPPPGAPLVISEYENSDSDDDNERAKLNRRIRAYRSELNAEQMLKQDAAINRRKVRFQDSLSDANSSHTSSAVTYPSTNNPFCPPLSQQAATIGSDAQRLPLGVSEVSSPGFPQTQGGTRDCRNQMQTNYLNMAQSGFVGGPPTTLPASFYQQRDSCVSLPPHLMRAHDGQLHIMPLALHNQTGNYPTVEPMHTLRDELVNPARNIGASRLAYQASNHPNSQHHYAQQMPSLQMPAFGDHTRPHPAAISSNKLYFGASVEQGDKIGHMGVIEAKPQLKNRIASITKLVPTVLKVKRTSNKAGGSFEHRFGETDQIARMYATTNSTDVAYDTFMKEMENVLK